MGHMAYLYYRGSDPLTPFRYEFTGGGYRLSEEENRAKDPLAPGEPILVWAQVSTRLFWHPVKLASVCRIEWNGRRKRETIPIRSLPATDGHEEGRSRGCEPDA